MIKGSGLAVSYFKFFHWHFRHCPASKDLKSNRQIVSVAPVHHFGFSQDGIGLHKDYVVEPSHKNSSRIHTQEQPLMVRWGEHRTNEQNKNEFHRQRFSAMVIVAFLKPCSIPVWNFVILRDLKANNISFQNSEAIMLAILKTSFKQ